MIYAAHIMELVLLVMLLYEHTLIMRELRNIRRWK